MREPPRWAGLGSLGARETEPACCLLLNASLRFRGPETMQHCQDVLQPVDTFWATGSQQQSNVALRLQCKHSPILDKFRIIFIYI